jgi:hypothetical protein
MAKFTAAPLFEVVSGALNRINKKSPHAEDQTMVLTTHRKAPTTSPDCSRVYLRGLSAVSRTTPVTENEQAVRNKFAAVSVAVNARIKDSAKIPADTQAFNAQKDLAHGKKTMRSYLWSLESAAYDAALNG